LLPLSYKNKATLASYLEPLKGSNVLSGYIKRHVRKKCLVILRGLLTYTAGNFYNKKVVINH
jgi:hypothetical protein